MLLRRLQSLRGPVRRWVSTQQRGGGLVEPHQYVSLHNYVPLEERELPRLRRGLLGSWKALGVSGRIYLSSEGINGQLILPVSNVAALSMSFPHILNVREEGEEVSLCKGKNLVFDQREEVTEDFMGRCFQCSEPCNHHTNCSNVMCGGLILQCSSCASIRLNCCSEACKQEFIKMKAMTTHHQKEYRKHQTTQWMSPIPNALSKHVSKRSAASLARNLHTRHYTISRTLMKSIDNSALQNDYVYNHSSVLSDDALLQQLREDTARNWPKAEQLIDEMQGKFLSFLVQTTRAQRILEIGCFTGYSALCLANGLSPGGSLVTCDIDADTMQFAQKFFDKSSHSSQITAINQDGLEYLSSLGSNADQPPFDFIFVDANKRKYREYYDWIFEQKLLHPSGLLVFDNTLFRGRVAAYANGFASNKERIARGLAEFNSYVDQDPRTTQVVMSLWDGLTLVRLLQQ
ncbi:hypothetical protein V7S43_001657 [Phytophthora oleae]|uniref:C2H2-type domain-containing protein n=1 Tax=Phytophthora oleae TaxID=2107226 RepID=A0ABD3G704_9STRA